MGQRRRRRHAPRLGQWRGACRRCKGRKDDWDRQRPLPEFAISNADSVLGGGLTPSFIDRRAHPRLPLSPPRDEGAAGESPARCAQRMRPLGATVRARLAAAQAARKAKLDAGRVDTVLKVGDRGLRRTRELLDALHRLYTSFTPALRQLYAGFTPALHLVIHQARSRYNA